MPKNGASKKLLGVRESEAGKPKSVRRGWCFTLNNYTEAECDSIKKLLTKESVLYAVVGKEVADSGTPHLQGYVHLRRRSRFSAVKKLVGERAHIESARGSDQQNKRYCLKEGNALLEVGIPCRGNTNEHGGDRQSHKLTKIIQQRQRGISWMEILREDPDLTGPVIQYKKNIEMVLNSEKEDRMVKELKSKLYGTIFKFWQWELVKYLKGEPDPREVYWLWDAEGGKGKTHLSKITILSPL